MTLKQKPIPNIHFEVEIFLYIYYLKNANKLLSSSVKFSTFLKHDIFEDTLTS